jgi:hypothetical protein
MCSPGATPGARGQPGRTHGLITHPRTTKDLMLLACLESGPHFTRP